MDEHTKATDKAVTLEELKAYWTKFRLMSVKDKQLFVHPHDYAKWSPDAIAWVEQHFDVQINKYVTEGHIYILNPNEIDVYLDG